ncbi:MAG: hypothetical protein FWD06_01185 [Oscillospiraceae bacterium]|nr:hypothetical protein [Oscillospiraceae bacterium]
MKRIVLFGLLLCIVLAACTAPTQPAVADNPVETTAEYTATTDEITPLGLPNLPQQGQGDDLYTSAPYDWSIETQTHTITQAQVTATQAQTTTTTAHPAITLPNITTRTTTTTTTAPLPTRPTGIGTGGGSGGSAGTAHTRVTVTVTRAGLIAMGGAVTQTSHMVDSIGRESERLYTGVPLRNVLQANGVNVNTAPAGSTVVVTAHDGTTFTLNPAQFAANTTLLAWVEDRGAGDVRQLDRPRLVFPQGLSGTFIQQVVSITFNP